ncbi:MAG: aldo/keto reductase [Pyrinomonadaceae bacterium]
MTRNKIDRRKFIGKAALSVTAAAAMPHPAYGTPGKLPQRTLGRTGASVPILAFGCGSRFLMYRDEEEALRVLNQALDSGITYLDTAIDYGNGMSETRVGMVMKTRRRETWLATKVPERARSRDAALREVEQV